MNVTAWIGAIFDHPVTDPAWYWDDDASVPDDDSLVNVRMLRALYDDAPHLLAAYSDAQVDQGLWLVTSGAASIFSASLTDTSLPWPERRLAFNAMPHLFERFFAHRCSEHLLHIDEPGANPINGSCYMWWDILPIWPEEAAPPTDSDLLCIDVMARTLRLESIACRESALHGLGHWTLKLPHLTQPIIDAFVQHTPNLRPELLEYARRARIGKVA